MSTNAAIDYRVSGRVGLGNLRQIREDGEAAIEAAGSRAVFDLSDVENGNSAVVALLMAWFRAAAAQEKSIEFVRVPAEIKNIVELSGLTEVLPIDGAAADGAETFPAEAQ